MQVQIKDGNLIIALPIISKPSASGKNTTIATTGGNVLTNVLHDGKPIKIGVNAFIAK